MTYDPEMFRFSRMKLPAGLCIIIAGLWAAQTAAMGATIVLSATKDNTLFESSTGALSNGQGDYLYVGKTGVREGFNLRRGLITFDLTSIPADATITGVTLSLFVSRTSPNPAAQTVNISLHAAARDWGEGLSDADSIGGGPGAPAQAGDATWLHNFYNTSFWTAAGGDFRSAASATTAVTANGSYSWVSARLTADVQAWVANSATNFGWFILGAEGIDESAIRFNSSENTANFPQLTITYAVPEPSSFVLCSAGALLGFLSRRRLLRLF